MTVAAAVASIPVVPLAHAASLEASAIFAFRRLARELRAHGAPRSLIRASRSCARDHIERIRATHGSTIPPMARVRFELRDLETLAIENAVDGCVTETYAAALSSSDCKFRHAALSWALHAWSERRLSPEARARVKSARDAAVRVLLDQRATREEHALATAIAERLWAA
jgi:hypothetical protein